MLRILSLALAAGVLGLSAASAAAADPVPSAAAAGPIDTRVITAAQLKSVTDYFATKGVGFRRTEATSGNLFLVEKDEAFRVSFFCGVGQQACQGQTYNTLIFWACDDSGANRTVERANEVNKGKVFGRSYIGTDGKACVEQEVVTGVGGITYEVMDIYYAGFTDMRTQLPQNYL
ncbi:MAG: hypothetical protein P0Y56_06655 [Candidatus Andeanibacterium colombiense]|uniref:YbjN domain-containing protein n=1 Tax=Candidatus Andeanibacterium colombiense TaxID=3121345 RepID=A0AAJ5X9C1_9SPHN|nr:MAG: hypothetical protein P0Y56_06655 [Sphingomonadaceae bacterium]